MQIFDLNGNGHKIYSDLGHCSCGMYFFMTPVYYGMVETEGTLPAGFAQGGFFETVGISIELLSKPMGMYSFLTGFS